jgi:hypothetical protein
LVLFIYILAVAAALQAAGPAARKVAQERKGEAPPALFGQRSTRSVLTLALSFPGEHSKEEAQIAFGRFRFRIFRALPFCARRRCVRLITPVKRGSDTIYPTQIPREARRIEPLKK